MTGEDFKRIRTDLKLTQDQMASLLKVTKSTISKLESERGDLLEHQHRSPIVPAMMKIGEVIRSANKGVPEAINFIDQIYDSVEGLSSWTWVSGVGPVLKDSNIGKLFMNPQFSEFLKNPDGAEKSEQVQKGN